MLGLGKVLNIIFAQKLLWCFQMDKYQRCNYKYSPPDSSLGIPSCAPKQKSVRLNRRIFSECRVCMVQNEGEQREMRQNREGKGSMSVILHRERTTFLTTVFFLHYLMHKA